MTGVARLALLLSLLVAPGVGAQAPHADWRTVSTAHFRVHYPAAAEVWALHTAERLEAVRERVVETVGFAPAGTVDVVVADPTASANGEALPLLGAPRLVLWTTPPPPESVIGHFRDWPEMLAVHETTHLAHLLRPSRNPLARLAEALLPVGPITLRAPRWLIEGYATLVEGDLTAAGRPFSDLRTAILRRRAQVGELPGYAALASDSTSWQGMSMAYLAGSAYLEWLRERAGPDSLRHLWARMTARRARSFDEAFAGVFGDPPEKLYRRFTAELTYRALAAEARVEPERRDGELWQDLAWSTGPPEVSPYGAQLALVRRFKEQPSELVVWSTGPDPEAEKRWQERVAKTLARDREDVAPVRPRAFERRPVHRLPTRDGAEPYGVRWTRDGRSLVYCRLEPDGEGFLHPDVFRWTPGEGRVQRLTWGADLREPDPAPGGWAVAVRSRYGLTQLVRVALDSGAVTPVTGPSLEVCASPRLDPEGGRVAYLRHAGGRWRLLVRRLDDGAEQELEAGDQAFVAFPTWSPDGREVLASLGRGGFIDVWAFAADGSAPPRPLTRTHGAALAPAPTPDGRALFFLSLEADGLDLRRLELEAASPLQPPAALEAQLAPAVRPQPGVEPASFATRPVSPPGRYGAGRQELEVLLGGAWAPSARTVEAGLRLGDVVGRLDLLAVGAYADQGGAGGGAVAVAWRGLPVELSATAFTARERPSTQPVGVPGLGAGLDRDRSGLALGAALARVWRGGEIRLGASGLWNEVDPVGGRSVDTSALGLEAELRQDHRRGRLRFGGGVAAWGQLGQSGDQRWRRLGGRAELRLAWRDLGLGASWERRASGGELPEVERYVLGGVVSTIVPAAARWERVLEAALPVDTQVGDSAEGQRLEFSWKGLPLFYARHRLWLDGERRGDWLSLAGVEVRLGSEPWPLVRLPGFELDLGVARILDPPFEGSTEWWFSIAWRP